MIEQNFKNHRKFVTGYHFVSYFFMFVLLILSLIKLVNSIKNQTELLTGISLVIVSILLILAFYYLRAFALKAQDRTIVLEENIRNYMKKGKFLDKRLSISQIIALRFASDEEYDELSQKVIDKKLSGNEIKSEIKHWKSDHYRL